MARNGVFARPAKWAAALAATAAGLGLLMLTARWALRGRGPASLEGIETLDDAVAACRHTGLRGWESVTYAQRLGYRKFAHCSCRSLWDTLAQAFRRVMGYCTQYNRCNCFKQALILTLFWSLAATAPVQAQEGDWTWLGGPTAAGGTADAVAVAPSAPQTVYALMRPLAMQSFSQTSGWRLYRGDAATVPLTWQQSYTFTTFVRNLAVHPADPATLYAGGGDGLYRSRDSGLSWTRIYTVGAALAVATPTRLYAGGRVAGPDDACRTGYVGVAVSDDAGATWRMKPIGCAAELQAIVVHPQHPDLLYAGGLDDHGKAPFIQRSTDGGTTWQALTLPRRAVSGLFELVVDPLRAGYLYLSAYWGHGLDRSTDGGETWHELQGGAQRLPASAYRLTLDAAGRLFAADAWAAGAIYRSDDGGETWWAALAQLPRGAHDLTADPQRLGVLWAGLSDYGLYRTTNGGGSWAEENTGIRTVQAVRALAAVTAGPVYAGAEDGRGGLFRSDDGLTWTTVISDIPMRAVAVHPLTPTYAYAGGPQGVYELAGNGAWLWLSDAIAVHDVAVARSDPEQAYAVGEKDRSGWLLRRGIASPWHMSFWQAVPISGAVAALAVAVHPQDAGLIYVGGITTGPYGKTGVVYRSEDAGEHWRQVLGSLPMQVGALAINERHPEVIYAGTGINGVYRTTDGGETWGPWATGLTGPEASFVYAVALDDLGNLYAGTVDGLYCRPDPARPWTPCGFQGRRIRALAAVRREATHTLFAGADDGVWRRERPVWGYWLPLVGK